ncbi:MAG: hypothetical protein ACI9KE_001803 [Polyangiales bacterium]|jgi:hypothetical protein
MCHAVFMNVFMNVCMNVFMKPVAVRYALVLSLLITGACATSSAPGGVDAGRFDAPAFDVPVLFDSPAAFDAGAPDVFTPRPDTGPRDAGPAELDAGPPERDAGRPDTGPRVDGGLCTPDGSYETTPDPSNPAVCSSAGVEQCRVGSAGSNVRLTCGRISSECTLDDDCTCSGRTNFAGVDIDVFVDFDMGLITFSAMGQACNFTLARR